MPKTQEKKWTIEQTIKYVRPIAEKKFEWELRDFVGWVAMYIVLILYQVFFLGSTTSVIEEALIVWIPGSLVLYLIVKIYFWHNRRSDAKFLLRNLEKEREQKAEQKISK